MSAGLSSHTSTVPTPVLTPILLPMLNAAVQMAETSGECCFVFICYPFCSD